MSVEISILIPCLDEEQTIARCVKRASESAEELGVTHEVIVIDNDSKDDSARKAREAGAKVVFEGKKGYGNAYKRGIKETTGAFVFMGDGDNTYDFRELKRFYKHLKNKRLDMVIGNRFTHKLEKGVMPGLHKHIGNPLLSGLTRVLFKSKVRDVHCGMRLIRREELERMELASPGMEFATEMVIKAAKRKLKVGELPIRYKARQTPSKLESFNDGWRHLRFMLLFSPATIFLLPGTIIFLTGVMLLGLFAAGPVQVGAVTIQTHPLFIGSIFTITGFQMLITGYFAKVFAANKYHDNGGLTNWLQRQLTLERGLLAGGMFILLPLALGAIQLIEWVNTGIGGIEILHMGIILLTLLIVGVQIVFNSFYYISVQLVGEENE